jgi:hypothetical protein
MPDPITEPTFADGEWLFPDTWSPADRAAFVEADEQEQAERARLQGVQEQIREEATSPATLIAAKREATRAALEERQALETERAEDAIFAKLAAEYGGKDRVFRLHLGRGGRSIMLRPQTEAELDAVDARASKLSSDIDRGKVMLEGIRATVKHPPRAEFDKIVGDYPGIWKPLIDGRDKLIKGVAEEQRGKE